MATAKKRPAAKKAAVKAGTGKEAAEARRRLFVEAYIQNGGNATEAAKTAGYSVVTAGQQGSRLLKDVNVQQLLGGRQEKLAAKFELTTEAVLKNLAQAIYFDPRKLYQEDGSLKPIHELDDDAAQALAGFEVVEMAGGGEFGGPEGLKHVPMYTKKVKWLDKNAAREQAMKHLGLYREDNKQRNPLDGLPREVLKDLVDRLKG
jgi:phage terminase small subunit